MAVKLKSKEFATPDELCAWANGKIATTDVIEVCVFPKTDGMSWVLFYQKDEA